MIRAKPTIFKEAESIAKMLDGLLSARERLLTFKYTDGALASRLGQVTARLAAAGLDRLEGLADELGAEPPSRSTVTPDEGSTVTPEDAEAPE